MIVQHSQLDLVGSISLNTLTITVSAFNALSSLIYDNKSKVLKVYTKKYFKSTTTELTATEKKFYL